MSKVKILFLAAVDSFWEAQSGKHILKTDRNNLENGDIFYEIDDSYVRNYYLYHEGKLLEVPIGTAIMRI